MRNLIDYLLLVEKPSAAQNFAHILGGQSGTFDGKSYQIARLAGHVLEYVEPYKMVDDPAEQLKLKRWSLDNLPWDTSKFNWSYKPIKDRLSYLKDLKKHIKNADPQKIVIATDCDPSGEGDLIGWEAIDYVGWKGPVGRMWFDADDKSGVQKAFKNIYDVTDRYKDPHYMRGLARQRFDYCSMQHSREATLLLQNEQYRATIRIGRLKSVEIKYIYDQIQAHNNYVKKPYYMLHYKDEAGHVFKLSGEDDIHYATKDEVPIGEASESPVVKVSHTKKVTAPPKFVSLSDITADLAHQYPAKLVSDTYEAMYQADYLSYPRTEDSTVSMEQFQELVDNSKKIASVVGVDTSLLTHLEPRKKYISKKTDHGANRPGSKIPANLDELRGIYGEVGAAIYDYVARASLVALAEGAVYDHVEAILENKASWSYDALKEPNWKAIIANNVEVVTDPKIPNEGDITQPFIDEGVNKRTSMPTQKRLMAYLKRVGVGTGATRTQSFIELARKGGEVIDKRGKLTLSDLGEANAIMIRDTIIATPEATKNLSKLFDDVVKTGDLSRSEVIEQRLLARDEEAFKKNAKDFKNVASGSVKDKLHQFTKNLDNSFEVEFQGQKALIKKTFGGKEFTPEEIEKLQHGEKILFEGKGRKGPYKVNLWVDRCKTDTGHEYIGLASEFEKGETFDVEYNGKTYPINKTFGGQEFTDEEIEKLQNGEKIEITRKSKKTGKPYTAVATIGESTYNGKKRVGVVLEFNNKK